MDNADLDLVMFVENIFDTHVPEEDAENLSGQLGMEEWLEQHLSSQRPNQDTAGLLRMLAKAQQRPELAEGLDRTWRREQISALVGDIFRKRSSPIELHEMLETVASSRVIFVANGEMVISKGALWTKGENSTFTC